MPGSPDSLVARSRSHTAAYSARKFFTFVGRLRWVMRIIVVSTILMVGLGLLAN